MKNQFYNRKSFHLIMVKFTPTSMPYTYACYKKLGVETGDVVVVPTNIKGVLGDDPDSCVHMDTVMVIDTTNDMNHIPQDYPLKHVISKVDTTTYDSIHRAKVKYIRNARSRKSTKRL